MTSDGQETPEPAPVIRIDPGEVASAALPGRPASRPRVSHLAVASLILGLLAFPLIGLLLGPIAIACGVLALGGIQERADLRGGRLAVAGIALGTLSLIAWVAGLAWMLSRRTPDVPVAKVVESAARADLGIEDAPAPIRRALRANVFLQCTGGDGKSAGSGVIVARDATGYCALTNRHVVECGRLRDELMAATPGRPGVPARVCWSAPFETDLAVVRVAPDDGVPEPPIEAVQVRTGDLPRVGDPVFAVGNPFGYEASYTAGVVSAVRTTPESPRSVRVLQVQVSVNPGNSGGGLYDRQGRLVGLTTWARREADGIGFAIAAVDALSLLGDAGRDCGCTLPSAGGGKVP